MQIDERKITVANLSQKYVNNDEDGVVGFDGKLDIRPKYQREFIYDDDKRNEVVRTILRDLPLNVFYWCKIQKDDGAEGYEVLDGQQRTISVCEYVNGSFSVDGMYFDNLPPDIKQKILDYELFVYICDGTDSEKFDWFQIINIAGEKLTTQELRNATFAGSWTSDAKKYFSKTNGSAYRLGKDYMKGVAIRQDYLETTLSWIANRDGIKAKDPIQEYMAKHQFDKDAKKLWNYFKDIISWVKEIFPKYRKEMRGVQWGLLYNSHGQRKDLDPDKLELRIQELMADEDVTSKSGIYEYVLTGDEKKLSIRKFSERDKREAYEKQSGKCAICGKEFDIEKMHADHIVPWIKGGATVTWNCQMLCSECNLKKGANSTNK